MNFTKKTYLKIFPEFLKELELAIADSKTVLDVGCGDDSPIRFFSEKFHSVGVDLFEESIEKSKKLKIHNEYCKIDVLDIGKEFDSNSFDSVIAIDLIEHLEKKDGIKLLEMMEKIAKNRVIIFTPNGFLPQDKYNENPWQKHRSGWTVKEMENRGYEVIGIQGWKALRGDYAKLKFRPKWIWRIISDITQLFVRNKPQKAFQILCIKNKK